MTGCAATLARTASPSSTFESFLWRFETKTGCVIDAFGEFQSAPLYSSTNFLLMVNLRAGAKSTCSRSSQRFSAGQPAVRLDSDAAAVWPPCVGRPLGSDLLRAMCRLAVRLQSRPVALSRGPCCIACVYFCGVLPAQWPQPAPLPSTPCLSRVRGGRIPGIP